MPRIRPFKGVIAKALLGEDEAFGGDKGLIDFVRPKKKVKKKAKKKKAVKKNMGGMMKSKGYSRGGAAKKTKGYSRGGAVKRRGVGAAKRGFGKAMR